MDTLFDSWTCHVCGELRPDDKILVLVTRHGVQGLTITQNVRYCADREECKKGASRITFVPRDVP